ncbi:MAG: alpha/beta fold hydrolase [Dehalococcoidia bacterium]
MPFAPVNGIELYYEVHGSGPAVLFAHGQGGNHLSWWQQVPTFSRHYTCITYDARHFGKSIDLDGKGRRAFGDDAMGLLDLLGVEDVRIVAHSMGGRPATAMAVRDPKQRVKALVLSGTTGAVADEAVRARRETAEEARGGKGLGAFSVHPSYKETNPHGYFLLRQISRLNPSRPKDFLGPPNPPPLQPGEAPRKPIYERLNESGTPVLFLVGEHDMITPADLIEMCAGLLPTSRYHMSRGSGHSVYWEKPEEFNEVVLRYLQEIDGASEPPD